MMGVETIDPASEDSVFIPELISRRPWPCSCGASGASRRTGLMAARSILGLSARGARGAFGIGFGLGARGLAGRE